MSLVSTKSIEDKLQIYGIDIEDNDRTHIELIIEGVEEYVKNYCNIYDIPYELYNTIVDMCCGTYLKARLSLGTLDFVDSKGAISSITEGDVSLGFREGTGSSEILKTTIDTMLDKKGVLECFRKMKW